MKTLNEKLDLLKGRIKNGKAKIMILGLGSVGAYLLDYLLSDADENMQIYVVGRNAEKMLSDVNIAKVSALIRGKNKSEVIIKCGVDFDDVNAIKQCIEEVEPDIMVNSSRAYPGLKYGSISWGNVRAYGIWSPLSIRYVKNIMSAYEQAKSDAIVINTSYSDAVIPWLKSAGMAYPDFGSGNLNHLIPRIKFAVAQKLGVEDFWNIDVTLAVSHFHDVVISKEGQVEGVYPLIHIEYRGEKCKLNMDEIYSACRIAMPVDAKRNMMNASSNYQIISGILAAVREDKAVKLHSPGVFGEIGGYPVIIGKNDYSDGGVRIYEKHFTLKDMRKANRASIYLDGIESVENGKLVYTDELLYKVKKAFGVKLVKEVDFGDIEGVAGFLIKEIIEKFR